MIVPQLEVKGILDDFIEKVASVNKPYLALVKTPQYHDFKESFASGIRAQAKWAADNINKILERTTPLQPLNGVQTTTVKGYITKNTPSIATQVKQSDVTDYFKHCFEWGAVAQYQRWFTKKAAGQAYTNFSLTNQKYLDALNDQYNHRRQNPKPH
jgi:hypothetical protein